MKLVKEHFEETTFSEKMNKALFEAEKKAKQEERERILKIIDEIMEYGDTVEGGIAEGILILVKSKINK